jgi:hypothetical protein
MKTIVAEASTKKRTFAFIDAFRKAPNDADLEISLGMDENYIPALLITVNGAPHILYIREARAVAEIFERTMREHPDSPEVKSFPNLIMALRMACDKSDAGHRH